MTPRPPQPLPVLKTTASSLLSEAESIIAKTRELHASLVKNTPLSSASFDNILCRLAQGETTLLTETRKLTFYQKVSPDARVREASRKANELFDGFKSDTAMNEPLFKLVDAVYQAEQSKQQQQLDPESLRFLEKVRRDHIANGLSLPAGPERERSKEIKARLSRLESEFHKSLADARSDSGGIWFSPEQLDGVPGNVLERLESGQGENTGLLRVTFINVDVFSVLRYAEDAATRKRMFIALENMVPSNVSLLKEAVVLRDEAARLLGYPNHAVFSIEEKMAKTPETVHSFNRQLTDGLAGAAKDEARRLKQLKREHLEARGKSFDGRLYLWDTAFYGNLALKKEHSVDQQALSEYFPLDRVVPSMLKIFEHLLGFRFFEVCGEDRSGKVWHEDVQVYSVWDADELGGEFLGYLYLDLYPREGKVGHPCSANLIPGVTGQYSATAMLCSFPKATSTQPSLLPHDQVVMLFHELGHSIHDLACTGKVKYARFYGPDGTAVDFNEAPSQLLEFWFWAPSVLKAIGRHYSYLTPEYAQAWGKSNNNKPQPPEKMPDEMIERLVATKQSNQALATLRQVVIGVFDMAIHSPSDPGVLVDMDLPATYNRMRRDLCQLEDPSDLGEGDDWGHGFAIYPHLMDGYDAGFYGYLFSKIYAADIFKSMFEADPMNAVQGLRYRRAVLEMGATQDELKTLTEYLGREPRADAFYQGLSLA